MRDSLNFDLIRQEITPWPTLDISEEYDTILDKSTWCAILGPDASGHIWSLAMLSSGMTKVWQLDSLLGSKNFSVLFAGTVWEELAIELFERLDHAVDVQDREFLDGEVPVEMAAYGLAKKGTVVYRSDNGIIRTRDDVGGEPVPLAWVLIQYGGELAEEILEKGSIYEPGKSDPYPEDYETFDWTNRLIPYENLAN